MTKTVRVKCEKCSHQAEVMGDERSTWLCNCAAGIGPDDCRCDHLNVVEEAAD